MDAGFRRQVERILHLVEGGRNAAFLHPLVDEHQQLMLFSRQHRPVTFESEHRRNDYTCSIYVLQHGAEKGAETTSEIADGQGVDERAGGLAGVVFGWTMRKSAAASEEVWPLSVCEMGRRAGPAGPCTRVARMKWRRAELGGVASRSGRRHGASGTRPRKARRAGRMKTSAVTRAETGLPAGRRSACDRGAEHQRLSRTHVDAPEIEGDAEVAEHILDEVMLADRGAAVVISTSGASASVAPRRAVRSARVSAMMPRSVIDAA